MSTNVSDLIKYFELTSKAASSSEEKYNSSRSYRLNIQREQNTSNISIASDKSYDIVTLHPVESSQQTKHNSPISSQAVSVHSMIEQEKEAVYEDTASTNTTASYCSHEIVSIPGCTKIETDAVEITVTPESKKVKKSKSILSKLLPWKWRKAGRKSVEAL